MKYLLDTHVLLWAVTGDVKLSQKARRIIEDLDNELLFSAASIWEIAIKSTLIRADFQIDSSLMRRSLLDNGYSELVITGKHAAETQYLPDIHKDPFDRILIAQSRAEGITLLSADEKVIQYGHTILAI